MGLSTSTGVLCDGPVVRPPLQACKGGLTKPKPFVWAVESIFTNLLNGSARGGVMCWCSIEAVCTLGVVKCGHRCGQLQVWRCCAATQRPRVGLHRMQGARAGHTDSETTMPHSSFNGACASPLGSPDESLVLPVSCWMDGSCYSLPVLLPVLVKPLGRSIGSLGII